MTRLLVIIACILVGLFVCFCVLLCFACCNIASTEIEGRDAVDEEVRNGKEKKDKKG